MRLYPCADDRKKREGGREEEEMGARLICRHWSGLGIDDEVSEAFEVCRASRRGGSQPFESLSADPDPGVAVHFVCRYLSVPSVFACQKLKPRLEETYR